MRILLIEDNPGDVRLIREMLASVSAMPVSLDVATCVAEALDRLVADGFDIILLDLMLPDSQDLDTFCRVYAQAPHIPIVVLSGTSDETLAIRALQEGAQDYLVKGRVDSELLVRALRYAIERHRMQTAIQKLTCDDLTGLYNRRGFLTHAEQQLKLVHRLKRGLVLFFADLDGLKQINDSFGHREGDQALVKTADVLRRTFRASDIIARLGGDEFTALAIDASGHSANLILARLMDNLHQANSQENLPYRLSLSVGIALFDPKLTFSIEQLIVKADQALYECKRNHRGNPLVALAPSNGTPVLENESRR